MRLRFSFYDIFIDGRYKKAQLEGTILSDYNEFGQLFALSPCEKEMKGGSKNSRVMEVYVLEVRKRFYDLQSLNLWPASPSIKCIRPPLTQRRFALSK
jgi:hypothetical protein